jgi:hypothetical protein
VCHDPSPLPLDYLNRQTSAAPGSQRILVD